VKHGHWLGAGLVALVAACGGKFEEGTGTAGTSGSAGSGGSSAGQAGSAATAGSAGDGGSGGDGGGGASGGAGKAGSAGSAGGGGSAGAGGSAGSAGTGGSGPCVEGGSCAPEGASCSDGACCPCVYQCVQGKWQVMGCAGCLAPMCPTSFPGHGDACDECLHPVGVPCEVDECAAGGIRAQAVCDGSTWTVSQLPCGSTGCCGSDAECPGMLCVSTLCKPKGADPCWRDDQCATDQICSGVFVCPCMADCAFADSGGTCVPKDMGCCRDDSDCTGTTTPRCVAGRCLEPAPAGGCWSDRDCFGHDCEGEQVCPCGASCLLPDVPGTCSR
jgi:hypothetical protein